MSNLKILENLNITETIFLKEFEIAQERVGFFWASTMFLLLIIIFLFFLRAITKTTGRPVV